MTASTTCLTEVTPIFLTLLHLSMSEMLTKCCLYRMRYTDWRQLLYRRTNPVQGYLHWDSTKFVWQGWDWPCCNNFFYMIKNQSQQSYSVILIFFNFFDNLLTYYSLYIYLSSTWFCQLFFGFCFFMNFGFIYSYIYISYISLRTSYIFAF